MPPFTPLFIAGQRISSSAGTTFEVRNPYTKEIVSISASASSQDCKAAIEAAGRAFVRWEQTSLAQRRDIFLKAADIVATERYRAKIMKTIEEETATVDYWATYNWAGASNVLRAHAGLISELKGEAFPSNIPDGKVVTQRRAMGVM